MSARRGRDDSGFALIFAMLFVLMLSSVMLFVLAQVMQETRSTRFAVKHAQTANSALAGLNAGLSRLRNAAGPIPGFGMSLLLPCPAGSDHATLTGTVGPAGTDTWQVDIFYLNVDPSSMSPQEAADEALPCPQYFPPSHAYLVSTGHGPALSGSPGARADRTLHATYDFTLGNLDVVGGQVRYRDRCWDVGPDPAVGSVVTWQDCLSEDTVSQLWYYRGDLSLHWEGNVLANLCLDYSGLARTPPSRVMTLQRCVGTGVVGTSYDAVHKTYFPGQQYQEFSTNDVWNGVAANGDRSSDCITSFSPGSGRIGDGLPGDQLYLATSASCGGAAHSDADARVSSGAAGGVYTGLPGPTEQLVSLAFHTRCLDVLASNPSKGLITYPCHQAPDLTLVEGNQRFQYIGTTLTRGPIITTRSGFYSSVCLQSDATATVKLTTCGAGTAGQQWLSTGLVLGNYADSYTVRDPQGRCLQAQQPSGAVGNIVLAVCNGSEEQKWNAPPGGTQSKLRDVSES